MRLSSVLVARIPSDGVFLFSSHDAISQIRTAATSTNIQTPSIVFQTRTPYLSLHNPCLCNAIRQRPQLLPVVLRYPDRLRQQLALYFQR